MTDEERLIDTTEAAAILGLSESQVRRLAACGELPSVRLGKQFRFNRRQLLDLPRDQGR